MIGLVHIEALKNIDGYREGNINIVIDSWRSDFPIGYEACVAIKVDEKIASKYFYGQICSTPNGAIQSLKMNFGKKFESEKS